MLRCPASPANSPDGADHKDPMTALVDQLHGGFHLRQTSLGTLIRGRDSTPGQHSAELTASAFAKYIKHNVSQRMTHCAVFNIFSLLVKFGMHCPNTLMHSVSYLAQIMFLFAT